MLALACRRNNRESRYNETGSYASCGDLEQHLQSAVWTERLQAFQWHVSAPSSASVSCPETFLICRCVGIRREVNIGLGTPTFTLAVEDQEGT
jgi:hypothetical protein